jgi:hypothetical protein
MVEPPPFRKACKEMKNVDLFLVTWEDYQDPITAEVIEEALSDKAWRARCTHIPADIAAGAHLVGIQQRGVTSRLLEEIRDELKSMRKALEKKP